MNQKVAYVQFADGHSSTMWRIGRFLYDTYTDDYGTSRVSQMRLKPSELELSLRELVEKCWLDIQSVTIR